MFKQILTLIAAVLLVNFCSAQITTVQTQPSQDSLINRQGAQLKQRLGLTDTQLEQLKQLHSQFLLQQKKLNDDATLNKEQRMAAFQKIIAGQDTGLQEILTGQQYQQLKSDQKAATEKAVVAYKEAVRKQIIKMLRERKADSATHK